MEPPSLMTTLSQHLLSSWTVVLIFFSLSRTLLPVLDFDGIEVHGLRVLISSVLLGTDGTRVMFDFDVVVTSGW